MPEIGATLREARMRARIDLSEVEAQTKIRARYLRALENEEWDLLPGPTFTKSFLRTYASALGLDGKVLVEEYRREHEPPGDLEMQPVVGRQRRLRRDRSADAGGAPARGGPSRGYIVAVALVALVIVLLVVGLIARGSPKPQKSSAPPTRSQTGDAHGRGSHATGTHRRNPSSQSSVTTAPSGEEVVKVYLQASETVWVCMVGEGEEKVIPGIELLAGESSGPYTSKRFEVTLGNNHVTLRIDGKPLEVPESTGAIGYEITRAGAKSLPPESQPTCE